MLALSNVRYVLPLSAKVGMLCKSEYVPVNATVLNSVLLFANALATSAKLSRFTLAPPTTLLSSASTYALISVLAVSNSLSNAKGELPGPPLIDALPNDILPDPSAEIVILPNCMVLPLSHKSFHLFVELPKS